MDRTLKNLFAPGSVSRRSISTACGQMDLPAPDRLRHAATKHARMPACADLTKTRQVFDAVVVLLPSAVVVAGSLAGRHFHIN